MQPGSVGTDQVDAIGTQRGDPQPHLGEYVGISPTGLGQHQIPLVVVAEQVGGSVNETGDLLSTQSGQLLGGISGECQAELPAFVGVGDHGIGIVGPDDHQIGLAAGSDHAGQRDVSGLRHRARVKRCDLRHLRIGGADEPRGVLGVGDQNVGAVDAHRLQPFPVIGEVDTGRTDKHRTAAEYPDGVRHVPGDAAPMHHEIIDQETQGHLLQMLGQQLLGELAGKPH